MSLKTKGFNYKNEALMWNGGGEMHSELLTGLESRKNFTSSAF
jgi:hypothetical protein